MCGRIGPRVVALPVVTVAAGNELLQQARLQRSGLNDRGQKNQNMNGHGHIVGVCGCGVKNISDADLNTGTPDDPNNPNELTNEVLTFCRLS